MRRYTLPIAIFFTGAALLGLLLYSLERTVWAFSLFEIDTTAPTLAAIVVELAAVALIISAGALDQIATEAREWADRALVAVLSVQSLANIAAGYLRGGHRTLALFGSSDDLAAYVVAAVLLVVVNLSIPFMVLALSKVLERLIAAAAGDVPRLELVSPRRQVVLAAEAQPQVETAVFRVADRNDPKLAERRYTCKKCHADGFTFAELGRHSRGCQG